MINITFTDIKISSKIKLLLGAMAVIILIVFWRAIGPYYSVHMENYVLMLLPAFLLLIPYKKIEGYTKVLSIICIVLILFFLLFRAIPDFNLFFINNIGRFSFDTSTSYVSVINSILQPIIAIYGLICAFILNVETKPETESNTDGEKFDKYCSNCGAGLKSDSKFCDKCGTSVKE